MKNKVLKRAAAASAAVLMAAVIIGGCSAKTDQKGVPAAANGAAGDSAAAGGKDSGDVATLVYWTIGGTVPSDFQQDMDVINEYLADKIHVKLDLKVAGWGDNEQKMNTIINSGEAFDMMFVNDTNYSRFVKMGAFADITDKLQTVAPDLYKLVPEQLWKGVMIDGKVYSVPSYKDSSMTQFWSFDDQYVQKYNIDASGIKTLQDLDKPFRDMKKGEGKGFYPLQLFQGGGTPFGGFFNNYDGMTAGLFPLGVKVDDESRTVLDTLEQPDIMENLKLFHQWYMDGIINPDANVLTESSKKLPFISAQGWPGAVSTWQTLNGVEKYDAIQVFGPLYSTETIQGSMNAISANSKHKDECLKFLQLVNTDSKLRDMLAYGVADKTFQYVGDGVIKKLTDTWPLAAYTQGTFFNMSVTQDTNAEQWNEVKKQNEEAKSSVCLGFSLDLTNIQNEMSNCLSVWNKYRYDLLTGASEPETTVPRLISELKKAGFDTIVSEAQKQLDDFYK